ncbi:MAG: flippase-like domain-containing protein [Erysipelotrichaceae bacterium]|nr:flippase-like domain-containing protein [Erysipelotrichaceae bacterium]
MKTRNYILNILVIALLTIGALWFALKDNYQTILDAIGKMNPLSLVLVLFWGAMYTAIWGLAYYVLGKKYVTDYTIRKGVIVAFVGAFFAGITPSSTGGQFGQAYILNKQGIRMSDSVSLLWADFIIYQTTMMIYVTILFLLRYGYYGAQSGWFHIILLGYLINAVVILALYTVALFPKVYIRLSNWLARFLGRFKFIKNPEKLVDSWNLQVTQFTGEVKELSKDKKRIFYCVCINVLRLTLLYSLPYAIALALHIPLKPAQLLDVITLSSFVLMANSFIPIPGASGGTEIVFALLFQPMMGALTGAVLVLWRFSSYHIVVIIGAILFTMARNSYEKAKIQGVFKEGTR